MHPYHTHIHTQHILLCTNPQMHIFTHTLIQIHQIHMCFTHRCTHALTHTHTLIHTERKKRRKVRERNDRRKI